MFSWNCVICNECKTKNWYKDDNDLTDLSKLDIEAIECHNCGKVFVNSDLSEEEYLKEFMYDSIEELNCEKGQRYPI